MDIYGCMCVCIRIIGYFGLFNVCPLKLGESTVSVSMEQIYPTYYLTCEETYFFLFQNFFYSFKSRIVF